MEVERLTEKVAMLIEQLAGKESENIRLKKEVERLTVLLIARNALAGGPPQEGGR